MLTSFDPNRTERFLFATGDVDSRLKPTFRKEFSVDRFFISAGLENFDQKDQGRAVADGIRAFLRKETGLNLNLVDTGLLVVNPGPDSSATQSALLHADFGLEGNGSDQKSTISVTIGNVEYKLKTCDCNPPLPKSESVEAVVEGRTIGSSRGTVGETTVGFSSPIRSTAAGGGNPALKEGYAGYFVLENYDPPDPVTGKTKTERLPLWEGRKNLSVDLIRIKLMPIYGSPQPPARSETTLRNELTLNGWMGGLAEFENGK